MSIPHGKKLAGDYAGFLEDLLTAVKGNLSSAAGDPDLKGIFKVATAAFSVLNGFSRKVDGALLGAAAGLARRFAVLAVSRQLSLSRVELRRLVECIFWFTYFVDHPVEREVFDAHPSRGWDSREGNPIATAASSPVSFYAQYAKERLAKERSGLGKSAVENLYVAYGELSSEVHAAMGAVHPSGSLALAFDRYDSEVIARIREESSRVFRDSVVAVAATYPQVLGGLDAIDRAWFDWLIGGEVAKKVRGEPFGIAR